jgi:hypothetical protein
VLEVRHGAAFVPRKCRKFAEILRMIRNWCAVGCKEV